jgi:hypothetical protein
VTKLTTQQQHALEWLPTVGKATPATLRRHGIALNTMRSLAKKQLVNVEYRRLSPSSNSYSPLYTPKSS